jgi:hypothetical protein
MIERYFVCPNCGKYKLFYAKQKCKSCYYKEYNKIPEVKLRLNAYARKYRHSQKAKDKRKERRCHPNANFIIRRRWKELTSHKPLYPNAPGTLFVRRNENHLVWLNVKDTEEWRKFYDKIKG